MYSTRCLGCSDVKRAKFSGTGMPGHSILWHGQKRAMPVWNIFGTGIEHRATGTKWAWPKFVLVGKSGKTYVLLLQGNKNVLLNYWNHVLGWISELRLSLLVFLTYENLRYCSFSSFYVIESGARLCPRAARAMTLWQRANGQLPVWIFSGTGKAGSGF